MDMTRHEPASDGLSRPSGDAVLRCPLMSAATHLGVRRRCLPESDEARLARRSVIVARRSLAGGCTTASPCARPATTSAVARQGCKFRWFPLVTTAKAWLQG